MESCRICGQQNCKKHSFKFNNTKRITEFSGSSPPEIFIGKWNYPNVNIGILSPMRYGDTKTLSSQEIWHKHKLSIPQILHLRSQLIYGRTNGNVKKITNDNRFLTTMQEVAMTSKSIAAEFKLNRPLEKNKEQEDHIPIITQAAFVKSIKLEENLQVDKKVDSLVNDDEAKSTTALLELENSHIPTSTIIKILSAGLLGLKTNRKLVPTRWAITAVDDTLSKNKLKRIKQYSEISEILLFTSEYLGNHYEFLLLPDKFSFEVIEINSESLSSWQDDESFLGRKNYASNVTGAYYANRLALTEYLENIKKQCSCLVIREISREYTQSMGVGILRQISRDAFSKIPEKFSSIEEALEKIQTRLKLNVNQFKDKSNILKNYGKQKKLENWVN